MTGTVTDAANESIRDEHGGCCFEVILRQNRIDMEVIGKMQPELFACAAEKVNKQNDNLQYAGGQRADRRTADAQLRESEITENQKIVNRTIDKKCHTGKPERNADDFHASKGCEQNLCDCKEQVSKTDNTQILCALFEDGGIRRENPKRLYRENADQQE